MNAFTAVALLMGVTMAGALYGLMLVGLDGLVKRGAAYLAGRISGLPILNAPFGCDDCSVEDSEPHRFAGCPGNVRQIERGLTPREGT